jgi:SM-20-related protein
MELAEPKGQALIEQPAKRSESNLVSEIPIDFLEIPNFLDARACAALRAELSEASGGPATVLSRDPEGVVAPTVRRTTRIAMPAAARERIKQLFHDRKAELERHFELALSVCEEPQFLRYQVGDFFVAHQDGNTPLIHDDSRFRRISLVLFLDAQAENDRPATYGGGSFVFHGAYPERYPLAPAPGTLLCFRAETTHEVLPVTRGERFTIVTWFR